MHASRAWKPRNLILTLTLALAACGGSGDAGDRSSAGTPASAGAGSAAPSGGATAGKGAGGAGSPAAGSGGRTSEGGAVAAAGSGGSAPMHVAKFDAGSDPNRNKVSAADVCKRLAEIDCAAEAYCCDNPGRTVDVCKADVIKGCSQDWLLDQAAQNPVTGYDVAAAERAYTELEKKASQCDPSVAAWASSPDGLRGLLKGTVAPDASCKPADALPEPAAVAAALLSCKDSASHACLYANPLDAWTCAQRAAAGGACITDNNCQDGVYCALPALQVTGTCTDRKAVGESCMTPNECKSLFCKQGKCVAADQQAAYCLMN